MSIRRFEYDREPRPRRVVDDDSLTPAIPDDEDPDALLDEEAFADTRLTTTYLESLPARINAALFAILLVIEGLLAFRFMLVAFGANRSSGFVNFIHNVSRPFVRPFDNVFRARVWDQGVVEPSTLLAMAVYVVVFLLIAFLVSAVIPDVEEQGAAVVRRRHYFRS